MLTNTQLLAKRINKRLQVHRPDELEPTLYIGGETFPLSRIDREFDALKASGELDDAALLLLARFSMWCLIWPPVMYMFLREAEIPSAGYSMAFPYGWRAMVNESYHYQDATGAHRVHHVGKSFGTPNLTWQELQGFARRAPGWSAEFVLWGAGAVPNDRVLENDWDWVEWTRLPSGIQKVTPMPPNPWYK